MSYSLIAGLNSFMEDDFEDRESQPVEIGPEAIDAIERAAEVGSEIIATDKDIEATAEQTEMFMERFDEIINRYNHVKKYGVDRTFMRLFNSENELSREFNRYIPSCESFSTVGDPTSKESVACMEDFKEIIKNIWNFITGIFKKVFGFIGKIFESIRVRIGDLNSQIGRLRKLNNERSYDVKNVENVDKQIWSLNDTTSSGKGSSSKEEKEESKENKAEGKAAKESFDIVAGMEADAGNAPAKDASKSGKSYGGGIQGAFNEISGTFNADKAVSQITDVIATLRKLSGQSGVSALDTKEPPEGINAASSTINVAGITTELEASGEKIKEFRKAWKETKKDLNKVISQVDKTEIKYVPGSAIDAYLNTAAHIASQIDKMKSTLSTIKTNVSNMNMIANNMDKRGDSESAGGVKLADHKKIANALSTAANLETEIASFLTSSYSKLAGMCVYAASARLSYRTKASEE